MSIFRVEYAVILFLFVSATLGGAILAVDDVLWDYALIHALGLLGFAILDVILIGLALVRKKVGFLGAGVFSIIQLSMMVANILVGAQFGVLGFSQEELTEYLLGTAKELYIGKGFWKLSPFVYDLLMAVQIPLSLAAFASYRRYHNKGR